MIRSHVALFALFLIVVPAQANQQIPANGSATKPWWRVGSVYRPSPYRFQDSPAAQAAAQDDKTPKPLTPKELTDVVKLQLQNEAQALEIWKLRLQTAQTEYQKSLDQFQKHLASLQVKGFQLNEQLQYVPVPPAPPTTPVTPKP